MFSVFLRGSALGAPVSCQVHFRVSVLEQVSDLELEFVLHRASDGLDVQIEFIYMYHVYN